MAMAMAAALAALCCSPKFLLHLSAFLPLSPSSPIHRCPVSTTAAAAAAADTSGLSSPSMAPLRIVAIAGSLRRASTNKGLIRAAVEIAHESLPDVVIEPVDIGHLPLLNTDLEKDGEYPDVVAAFREKVSQADAFLFASPEYNYSVTAPLKNAIDWASRAPNVWDNKPAAVMSAGGGFGGGRSQYHLRQTAVYINLHFLNKPEVFVRIFEPPNKFDEDGNLVDSATRERVKGLVFALYDWTLRLKRS